MNYHYLLLLLRLNTRKITGKNNQIDQLTSKEDNISNFGILCWFVKHKIKLLDLLLAHRKKTIEKSLF